MNCDVTVKFRNVANVRIYALDPRVYRNLMVNVRILVELKVISDFCRSILVNFSTFLQVLVNPQNVFVSRFFWK